MLPGGPCFEDCPNGAEHERIHSAGVIIKSCTATLRRGSSHFESAEIRAPGRPEPPDNFPTRYMAAETVGMWGCGPVALFAIRSAFLLGASLRRD